MSGSLTDVNKHLHLNAARNLIYAYIPYATHEILIYLGFFDKKFPWIRAARPYLGLETLIYLSEIS